MDEFAELRKAIQSAIKVNPIDWVTIHTSATRPKHNDGVQSIREMHLNRGWSDIGYHLLITRDGQWHFARPLYRMGAGVKGFNRRNLHVCLIGGVSDEDGVTPEDNYTEEQMSTLRNIVSVLSVEYQLPLSSFKGHRDWSPDRNRNGIIEPSEWIKYCPCFDVQERLKSWM